MQNSIQNIDKYFKVLVAFGGACASYLYGGWSVLLVLLVAFVVMDFLTGLLAAGYEGKLNSAIMWKSIPRKVTIFALVAIAHLIDVGLGGSTSVFMDTTIFFYLANELLSILENAGRVGVPIPPAIQQALAVLNDKGGATEKEVI